jgi:hypothetical protein
MHRGTRVSGLRDTFWAASTRELLSLGIEEATLLLREREGEGDSARGTNEPWHNNVS